MTRTARWAAVAEIALVASSLVAASALCRMLEGGGPRTGVLATAAVGGIVTLVVLRRRWNALAAALLPAAALCLTAVWTLERGATSFGLPTARTWHTALSGLHHAHDVVASTNPPYPAQPGTVLLAALTAGVAAAAARLLSGVELSSPLAGLAPPFVLVALSAFAVGGSAVVPAVALTATGTVLLVASSGPAGRAAVAGATAVVLLAVAALVGGIAWGAPFAGYRPVSMSPAPSPGTPELAGTNGSGSVSALSLVADVTQVERSQADVEVFSAYASDSTYWQVAVLDRFDGSQWRPSPATQAALSGGPPSGPTQAAASGPSNALITLDGWDARLLPSPLGTVAATGLVGIGVTTVGTDVPSIPVRGESYETYGALTPTTPDTPSAAPSDAASDLGLPALPAQVAALARQVTAGATSPGEEAGELAAWFRSGRFRYTLTPPATPRGENPLVAFLTTTRAGACQQFASAFAAMARTLGLPARVAVGFGPGRTVAGATIVTGADAHAWPEVYLGGDQGWTSFEPTPVLPHGSTVPTPVQTGPPALGPSAGPITPVATTTTTTTAPVTTTSAPPVSTVPSTARVGRHTGGSAGGGSSPWWVLAMALAALGALALAAVRVRRRPRSGRTAERSLRAWHQAERTLARAGWLRAPGETPSVLAVRLAAAQARAGGVASGTAEVVRAVAVLASVHERSLFAPSAPSEDEVRRAESALAALRREVARSGIRRELRALGRGSAGERAAGDRPPMAAVGATGRRDAGP